MSKKLKIEVTLSMKRNSKLIYKKNRRKLILKTKKKIDYNDQNTNYCVICGTEIPEGKHICSYCADKVY